ncbi:MULTISPECIES: YlxM family DNA-binding protein [Carboxydocella]|uniref:UPF0122 protein SAMN02745885_01449 n=2 Tax=Carboxydocella TaxID=178898 RepID=A0A1T4PXA3_9FIRM|nr:MULTISPECIES: sigma factor-like helix-turn-helix DNA-binding protein [Carboxydocella]AVX20481.1 hypothetical protein CFE_1292 [Carboxydocella thermautotrophica]AVX30902.1 hypothetical protein CTH_1312 [Carboxydocella thermautotrophica]SJZ96143.1 hypothetical protein SAMN02745885_01449 [Carboxydocella sporoproducens DSM 16521]GAW29702.1 DNA-binding protein [Carboxydocella sp. ULO1]GAW32222.1 DNA-binding protein [Carboxydocella sp. JDF658]
MVIPFEQRDYISLLLSFYSDFLTDKQKLVMELYYDEDLTLTEIAEQLAVSRQGVHDLLKRSLKQLEELEQKLGLVARYNQVKTMVEKIDQQLAAGQIDEARTLVKKLLAFF